MANNNNLASTRLFLFFALRGLHLRMSFDIIDFLDTTTSERINKKKTISILECIQLIWKYVQESLTKR